MDWPLFTQISGRDFLPELFGEVHFETAPLQALCCALCSTERSTFRRRKFSRGRKGWKGAEKRGGRGVASKRGKKEKRTHEDRSVEVLQKTWVLSDMLLSLSLTGNGPASQGQECEKNESNMQSREEKSIPNHHRKKFPWRTFLASKKNFPGRGGYKNPIKTRKTIPPNSFLCGPYFFLQRKVLHWSRAVYGLFFSEQSARQYFGNYWFKSLIFVASRVFHRRVGTFVTLVIAITNR